MKLVKLDVKTLCDNGLCGKIADYAIEREGTPLNMRLHLCNNCINTLQRVFWEHCCKKVKEKK